MNFNTLSSSDPYEEIVEGETILRFPPPPRHEDVLNRLHKHLSDYLLNNSLSSLLAPRSVISITPGTMLRPDLTIVNKITSKPWLILEVIHGEDHRMDTVLKKELYEFYRIPRLWILDVRYDNAEIYHTGEYGLTLKSMLAGKDFLEDPLLPGFRLSIGEVFSNSEPKF